MSDYGFTKSRVEHFNRTKDTDPIIVHKDSNHVCLMKLCPFADKNTWDDYKTFEVFHLRYYIPKFVYTTKNKKVKKLIIMFNGLNEISHYNLYDQIGQVLARRGIASVLIPMPDHLNRHPKWRFRYPEEKHRNSSPLKDIIQNPDALHIRFLQYAQEIDELYEVIKNPDALKDVDEEAYSFYKHIFSPNIRVSLFGYSMGGLAALSMFLADPNKYNACFLLNSGIQLRDIRLPPSMILPQKWEEVVSNASDVWKEQTDNVYSSLFGMLYLGNRPASITRKLKPVLRRLLFIFGGADSVIPMKSISNIEPDGRGLPIFQIPGISHFPAIDREWNNWSLFTVNLIAEFEDNASFEYWSKQEMIETVLKINDECSFFNGPEDWDEEKVCGTEHWGLFAQIKAAHSCFFPNFQTLLCEAILKDLQNNKEKHFTYNRYGALQGLDYDDVIELLKTQLRMCQAGIYKPFGELMHEKMGEISSH